MFYPNWLVYQGLQFGKNLVRQYFIFKLLLVIGCNNKFTVVRRQTFCKLSIKENYQKLIGITSMVPSEPRAYSHEIIAFQIVSKLIGINTIVLSDPWAESIDIIALK